MYASTNQSNCSLQKGGNLIKYHINSICQKADWCRKVSSKYDSKQCFKYNITAKKQKILKHGSTEGPNSHHQFDLLRTKLHHVTFVTISVCILKVVSAFSKNHIIICLKTPKTKQTIINYPNVSNFLLNIQLSSWLATESLITTSDKYYEPFTHVP